MAKEETTQTMIDESVIKAAIEAVQEKGIDLNPYTVADEADCSPEEIYRAPGHMKLIAEARGMSDPDHVELMKSLDELGRERDALAEKVAGMESREPLKTGDFPTPDEISEQMKELLESETENELKQLEEELEQAYTQTAQLQEENLELTHTISGLEKVNEALNARLRELEDQLSAIKNNKPVTEDSDPAGKDKLITENEALAERVKTIESENDELVERVKTAEGENEELSETVLTLQHKIISLENKLAELQQESESLAMQLQNAFHTSYEKGIQEGLKRAGAGAAAPVAEVKPLPETEPEEEPETATESGAEAEAVAPKQDLAPSYQDIVHNFAQTGPYVASDFNPLEDLKWRDLETVYGMGVLSIKDFSAAVTARQQAEAGAPPEQATTETEPEPRQPDQPAHEQRITSSRLNVYEETTVFTESSMDFTGSSDSLTPLPPEAYQSAPSPIDSQALPEDQIPDFDQLDIEELEQLGKIEVPEDLLADVPIDEVQRQKAQAAMGEEPNQEPSGEELRELLRNRIKQASEQAVEQQVRTPPAPGSEEGKGAPGLTKKFVGGKAQHNEQPHISQSGLAAIRAVPPEIRKHCQILGIREEGLTREIVMEAWKKEITSPGVHPDQGGDTELAVYLNTAKDALLRFIEDSGPKLGKKFGAQSSKEMSSRFTGKKKQES
ncbi:MAG: hypothetical protein AB7V06_12465 [Candidatus Obscuribacterales bacterium]